MCENYCNGNALKWLHYCYQILDLLINDNIKEGKSFYEQCGKLMSELTHHPNTSTEPQKKNMKTNV